MRRSQLPGHGGASNVSFRCLTQVENSLAGCRAEGSASTERFVADGVEGGRKDDLSEGGAVLRWKVGTALRRWYNCMPNRLNRMVSRARCTHLHTYLHTYLLTYLEGALSDGGEGGG